MTTIVDVSKQAGVSPATVSCVLNARTSTIAISQKTKDRVLQAATQLDYRRNEIARAMISGRLAMIGAVVPSVGYEVIGAIMDGILLAAEKFNYHIKIVRVGNRSGEEIADLCRQYRLAGMIFSQLSSTLEEKIYRRLKTDRTPFVIVDNSKSAPWKTRILSDESGGIRQAVNHLKTLGHRRIGFCASGKNKIWSVRRSEGFIAAMKALGMTVESGWIFHDLMPNINRMPGHDYAVFKHCMENVAARPTALLCESDALAMTVIRALRGIGLNTPQDVSVIGFANLTASQLCDPPLTTVRQPFREMGVAAMRQLMKLISNPDAISGKQPVTEILPMRLIARHSTCEPRQSLPEFDERNIMP